MADRQDVGRPASGISGPDRDLGSSFTGRGVPVPRPALRDANGTVPAVFGLGPATARSQNAAQTHGNGGDPVMPR